MRYVVLDGGVAGVVVASVSRARFVVASREGRGEEQGSTLAGVRAWTYDGEAGMRLRRAVGDGGHIGVDVIIVVHRWDGLRH